jgi:hypothetical protein
MISAVTLTPITPLVHALPFLLVMVVFLICTLKAKRGMDESNILVKNDLQEGFPIIEVTLTPITLRRWRAGRRPPPSRP